MFGRWKTRTFVATICFGKKTALFCNHTNTKSPNTTKIGVSAGTGDKTQMALLVSKVPFLGFPLERGLYYLWYTKAVLCCEHYVYSVIGKHSFAEIKSVNWKARVLLPTYSFFFAVSLFVGGFVFYLRVFVLCCLQKAPKRAIVLQLQSFCFYFVPPKGMS